MVTVLHLMLRRFHHLTGLKSPQFISYDTITLQVILKSIKDLQSYRSLNIQNIASQAVVIQCAAGETKSGKCEK